MQLCENKSIKEKKSPKNGEELSRIFLSQHISKSYKLYSTVLYILNFFFDKKINRYSLV